MTGSPRAVLVPALLAVLACSVPSRASAAELDTPEASAQLLAALRAMRYSGPIPALTGFSAARVVELGQRYKPGKDLSAAYRSDQGCVTFFFPLEKGQHDLALKWEGPKCNGQPLQGEGTLTIHYLAGQGGEQVQLVSVSRGRFVNGMLTGQGEKANFSFDATGQPKESIYAFSGEFASGVLNGLGRKVWTGPAAGQPSAQAQEGNFSEGVPLGEIVFAQLRPYPGVEAETKKLIFDTNGRPLLEQPGSKGVIFFEGDALAWSTEVQTLRSDWALKGAILYRASKERRSSLAAACMDWHIGAGGLRCAEGVLAWQFPGSDFRPQLFARPFEIPLPFETSGSPVRVQDQEILGLKGRPSGDDELHCTSDLTSCRGKSTLPLSAFTYFAGQVEYQEGEVRPVSGKFMRSPTAWDHDLDRDKELASCKEFRAPTRCRIGVVRQENGSWTGGYEFTGLEFAPKEGYLPGKDGYHLVLQGSGRFEWTEGGAWAEVVAEDNRFVAVNGCDQPRDEGVYACHLDDQGTVHFERTR